LLLTWQGSALLSARLAGCSCTNIRCARLQLSENDIRLRLCHKGFKLLAGQGFHSLEAWLAMRMARFLARDSERRSRCSFRRCGGEQTQQQQQQQHKTAQQKGFST
jgi:hypothetical protein